MSTDPLEAMRPNSAERGREVQVFRSVRGHAYRSDPLATGRRGEGPGPGLALDSSAMPGNSSADTMTPPEAFLG